MDTFGSNAIPFLGCTSDFSLDFSSSGSQFFTSIAFGLVLAQSVGGNNAARAFKVGSSTTLQGKQSKYYATATTTTTRQLHHNEPALGHHYNTFKTLILDPLPEKLQLQHPLALVQYFLPESNPCLLHPNWPSWYLLGKVVQSFRHTSGQLVLN